MKNIYLTLLCLLCMAGAFAQQDTTTFEGKSKYIFEHVDKSQVTTGLLSDYGAELLPLSNYNGSLLADSNYVGLIEWRQLYGSLFSAQINTNSNMPTLVSVNSTIENNSTAADPIAFAVMHYDYQSLRTDAVSANLMTVSNDQLFDVPGRSQSPYLQNTVFAVAPLRQLAVQGNNNILFKPELIFGNTGKTIAELAVAVGPAGTYQTVALNAPHNLVLPDVGFNDINIRITYTDASVCYSHTKLLAYPAPAEEQVGLAKNNGGISTQNYSPVRTTSNVPLIADKSYQGIQAQGDLTIQLASNNNTGQIRKPLIVVEGFDMENTYNFRSYINSLESDTNKDPSEYITLNYGLDSINEYDLVFLNFADATDYIQRNAFLLEKQ